MNEFTTPPASFNTKSDYLAWRQGWREHYRDLSSTIHDLKSEVRSGMKDGDYKGVEQGRLMRLTDRARSMNEVRTEIKESQKARRTALSVAA